mmetsp:Transcript_23247/g.55634  ORF Transcript_23247/g.55634 Transcript_23247/m.55634 type:complete len:282 (+) Transcript_23247:654-1499(+)
MPCQDDEFALNIGLGGDHVLGKEDLLWRDVCAQVAPGNHHSICLLDDVIKILQGRNGFDFGHQLDVCTPHVCKQVSDVDNVLCTLHEGCGDGVHPSLHSIFHVFPVLRRQDRQVEGDSEYVAAHEAAELRMIDDLRLHNILIDLDNLHLDIAIINEDLHPWLNQLAEVRELDAEAGLLGRLPAREGLVPSRVIWHEDHCLALLQQNAFHWLVACWRLNKGASVNLGPVGVDKDCTDPILFCGDLPHKLHNRLDFRHRHQCHVESCDIHPSIKQAADHLLAA